MVTTKCPISEGKIILCKRKSSYIKRINGYRSKADSRAVEEISFVEATCGQSCVNGTEKFVIVRVFTVHHAIANLALVKALFFTSTPELPGTRVIPASGLILVLPAWTILLPVADLSQRNTVRVWTLKHAWTLVRLALLKVFKMSACV